MAEALQTVAPDQLAKVSAVPAGACVLLAIDGAPLQAVPYDQLLSKLIKTDLVCASEVLLQADLAHAADTVALVNNDPTTLKNGWYRKTGAVGLGAWVLFEVLTKAAIEDLQEQLDMLTAGVTYTASSVAITAGMADGTDPILAANPRRRSLILSPSGDCSISFRAGEASGLIAGIGFDRSGPACPKTAIYVHGLAAGQTIRIEEGE